MTGIEYPTITVGSHQNLKVRMSLAAELLMRRRGIDVAKLGEQLIRKRVVPNPHMRVQTDPPTIEVLNPDGVTNIVMVFACMVAENFFDLSKPNKFSLDTDAPTADYWAALINEDFLAVEEAVWQALGKAVEARRAKLAVVPPTQEAAS